jgi:hypothetical protein
MQETRPDPFFLFWKYFNKRYSIDFLRYPILLAVVVIIILLGRYETTSAQIDIPQIVIKDGQETLVLPNSLTESIKTNFPGFRGPTASDMSGPWVSEKMSGLFPFIAWGDFNGDGLTDVAIILISDKQWKFIIFHGKSQGYVPAYEKGGIINEHSAKIQFPQQVTIRTVKKGEGWAPEGGDIPTEYKHEFDAIAFSIYGKMQLYLSLIYWDNGKYSEY